MAANPAVPNAPKTVAAQILLGWMGKDEAIPYLLEQCWFDPPLTSQQAEELWEKYRKVVEALPERKITPPVRLPIPNARREVVTDFLRRFKGPEVLDVINIDPLDLVIYQLYVVTDVADNHAKQLTGRQWVKNCLQAERPIVQMQGRMENGVLKFSLPHGEHMFALQPDGAFRIQQGAAFISVCEVESRLVLKAGYHRSFAFCRAMRNEPDAKDRSLLVALTKTVPAQLDAGFPTQGLRTTVLGSRPPLLSDFFNESLAMAVKLRKRRFEMHIKVDLVPVDESP